MVHLGERGFPSPRWGEGEGWGDLGENELLRLQVFQERPAIILGEIGAILMSRVMIPAQARVEDERGFAGGRFPIPDLIGIESTSAAAEGRRTLSDRLEEVEACVTGC